MAPKECLLWGDIKKHSQGVSSEAWLQDLRKKKNTDKSRQWLLSRALGGDSKNLLPGPWCLQNIGCVLCPTHSVSPARGLALTRLTCLLTDNLILTDSQGTGL